MRNNVLLVILLSFFIGGCTLYRINSEDISSDFYPSKESANDIAYIEDLQKPHEVIGYVTVNAERNQRISEVIEKMKREAAILGGDAITLIQTDASGQWKKLPAQDVLGNAFVRANFTATVVIFK